MTEALLSVRDLVAGYGPDVPIVRGASLTLHAGEVVALLGPNGAGKSTLARAIAGIVPVRAGSVRLRETDITGAPPHVLARSGLGFVPQSDNVFATMSVRDNLALAAAPLPRAARGERTDAMAALFPDLARFAGRQAGLLSGGQRQMLAIARALIVAPSVLLLDEPSAGLSPRLAADLFHMLARIRGGGVAVLLVEQNARAALRLADRGVVLVDGRPVHTAPASAMLGDDTLAALYLGTRAAA